MQKVAELGGFAISLGDKSMKLSRALSLLEQIDRVKMRPVEGEKWLLLTLEQRLKTCRDSLGRIGACEERADFEPHMDSLASELAAVDWDLLDDTIVDLEKKVVSQEAKLRECSDVLGSWKSYLSTLRSDLSSARNEGVPLIKGERFLLHLDGLVTSLDRAVREQNLVSAVGYKQKIDGQTRPTDFDTDKIQTKIAAQKSYALQADLLILQPPIDSQAKVYEYTVLLRTPSRPGSHGVNIQGTTTIVEADRNRVKKLFEKVTGALNQHIRQKADSPAANKTSSQNAGSSPGLSTREFRDLHLGNPSASGEVGSSSPNDLLIEIGDFMFRIFIPEQIAQFLKSRPCSLTLTTNDLELPWELMLLGDAPDSKTNIVCLNRPVGRLPMGFSAPRMDHENPTPRSKRHFLLIYSDPTGNLPGAKSEVEAIKNALELNWKEDAVVEVIDSADATGERPNEVLRENRYDVIHYAGHAAFTSEKPELSALLLAGHERFFAQKVRRLLRGRPLVFLNACQSAATSNAVPEVRYELKDAEGLAAAFIYGGAVGCLGAIWPVFDGPAAQFAISFYNKVLEGEMIGEAVRIARAQSLENFSSEVTWASFTLYGDPTFRVFS